VQAPPPLSTQVAAHEISQQIDCRGPSQAQGAQLACSRTAAGSKSPPRARQLGFSADEFISARQQAFTVREFRSI